MVLMVTMGTMFCVVVSRMRRQQALSYIGWFPRPRAGLDRSASQERPPRFNCWRL